MGKELSRTSIGVVSDVPWGTHFCQFYDAKRDLIEILVPYLKMGIENNEFCMWVTSEALRAEEAKEPFEKQVRDLDDHIAKGQMKIIDYRRQGA